MGFSFLIFDLDGTLIDSQVDITSAINLVRRRYGLKYLSVGQVRSYLGGGISRLIDKVIYEEKKIDRLEVEELFRFYYGKCLTDTTVMYKGVANMLEVLKDKSKAVLSNKGELFSCEILSRLKISDYFIKVFGGDSVMGLKKPGPGPIMELIKITNSDISKTVMIR
ncbi:MAG: HAD hydrolase-like protein [Endomicrobium sp.]|jgi:phosphoglycolate phosphatase|nr:HAD hydrolase-like protein [Endomicrobium sp.]